jgi:hypothetical protein
VIDGSFGHGMVSRRVVLRARDVVFFKGIVEATEGLAAVYATRGGELSVVAHESRAAELDAFLASLASEVPFLEGPTV